MPVCDDHHIYVKSRTVYRIEVPTSKSLPKTVNVAFPLTVTTFSLLTSTQLITVLLVSLLPTTDTVLLTSDPSRNASKNEKPFSLKKSALD